MNGQLYTFPSSTSLGLWRAFMRITNRQRIEDNMLPARNTYHRMYRRLQALEPYRRPGTFEYAVPEPVVPWALPQVVDLYRCLLLLNKDTPKVRCKTVNFPTGI